MFWNLIFGRLIVIHWCRLSYVFAGLLCCRAHLMS